MLFRGKCVHCATTTATVDKFLTQLKNKFKDHKMLLFLVLRGLNKFSTYRENFPESEFGKIACAAL